MWSIKSTYIITRHWHGDPCAPQEFVWEGIRCSYNDTMSYRITFLYEYIFKNPSLYNLYSVCKNLFTVLFEIRNLSSSGLNGGIDPGFANLTMIETL